MKRILVLICIGCVMGLVLALGGCVVAPPYDDVGGYYGSPGNVVIQNPPLFIYPPSLGFYAAIGIPYDLFYIDRNYYLHRGNRWYRSPRYNGPWGSLRNDHLPQGLRRHRYDDIVRGREREYRTYQNERNRYRGRTFRPEGRHESPNRGDHRRR